MNSASQFFSVKFFECRNNSSHFGYGADAQVPSAAVGRASSGYDLRPNESLVSKNKASFAGFRQNAGIRAVAFEKVLGADAGILLIGHQGDKHPPRKVVVPKSGGRRHDGGCAALHVITATAINAIAFNLRLKRRDGHALC